jgi:hypothetical protein
MAATGSSAVMERTSVVGDALRVLSVAALGVYVGAMLTEGCVLVPYWRSLPPSEFLGWYAANDRRLVGFFGPLTAVTALLAVAAALASLRERDPRRWAAVTAAALSTVAVATFFVYFERANARFAAAAIAVDDVPAELARWARWHWARTALSVAAFAAGLVSLAPAGWRERRKGRAARTDRVALTTLVCVAVASPALADGEQKAPSFVIPPQLPGWKIERLESDPRMPHLSGMNLESAGGDVVVHAGVRVLADGRPGKSVPGGVVVADDWLPRDAHWEPIPGSEQECFRETSTSPAPNPQYRFYTRARCRRPNLVLVFALSSRLDRQRSEAAFADLIPKVALGTKTTAECLTPQEMTHLADFEGPPFVERALDRDTVLVAERSMCGSGGCSCYRYERKAACFRLVLPRERCFLE